MGKLRVVLSGILAAALLLPQVALAAPDGGMAASGTAASSSTLVVNTTTDRRLQDGDVNCVDPGWTCSLRAAVQEANTNPAYDTIMVPAGGYVLTRAGISADGSSGALRLASSVTIVGAGPGLTVIDAGWRTSIPGSGTGDRVIDAVGGSSTIDGVTIRGGVSPGGSLVEDRGGGIHVRPGASLTVQDAVVDGSRAGQGGGIHNAGTLRLVRSEVRENRSDSQGGGIHASGPVELLRSVVASNTSVSPGRRAVCSPRRRRRRSSPRSVSRRSSSTARATPVAASRGRRVRTVELTLPARSVATLPRPAAGRSRWSPTAGSP
jgi:CSLREA domain-containing protein